MSSAICIYIIESLVSITCKHETHSSMPSHIYTTHMLRLTPPHTTPPQRCYRCQELTCWLIRMMAMSFRRVNSEKVSSMVARGVSGMRERMSNEQLPLASLSHGELTGIDNEEVTLLLLVDVANTGKQETSDRVLCSRVNDDTARVVAWMIVNLVTDNGKKVAVLVRGSRHESEKKQQLALGGVSSFFRIFLF